MDFTPLEFFMRVKKKLLNCNTNVVVVPFSSREKFDALQTKEY